MPRTPRVTACQRIGKRIDFLQRIAGRFVSPSIGVGAGFVGGSASGEEPVWRLPRFLGLA